MLIIRRIFGELRNAKAFRIVKTSVGLLLLFILAGLVSCGMLFVLSNGLAKPQRVAPGTDKKITPKIQRNLEVWGKKIGENRVGVAIYDVDHEIMIASFNEERKFPAQKIINSLLAYEGYVQISNGFLNSSDMVANGRHRVDCVNAILSVSDEACKKAILQDLNTEIFLAKVKGSYGIYATDLEQTTAKDVVRIAKLIEYDKALKPDFKRLMRENLALANGEQDGNRKIANYDINRWKEAGANGNKSEVLMMSRTDKSGRFIVVVLSDGVKNTEVNELVEFTVRDL